jgi:uncharacterized protein
LTGGLGKYARRIVAWRSRPELREFTVQMARWRGPDLTIAVLADLHVVAPWTTLADVARAVARVNAMAPDLVVLGGDYLAGHAIPGQRADAHQIADALAPLRAPHGVFAILGNHDWFDCQLAQSSDFTRSSVVEAFAPTQIQLMRNEALKLAPDGHDLWVVAFDSQCPVRTDWSRGLHRPDQAFADVPDGAATILLAHEPDYFAHSDARADLQISGHTHGGQLNLFGWRPLVPPPNRGNYTYGHYRDGQRSLVVSGGVGFSGVPLRIGQAPEITVIRLTAGTEPAVTRG